MPIELQKTECKYCGASVDISNAKNGVVKCAHCGELFVVAKSVDPEALDSIRIGSHELDKGKFDDAYISFLRATKADPEESEAYFGMALASFKVRYIKDEVNRHLQPICYEIDDSVFTQDRNYRKALQFATSEQKAQYEKSGKEIDYIRGEFYKLKQSGLDYDCFICVKVTDDDTGGRTSDYKIADDLYFHLKHKGYKPFFSEIEIGGRTGADYEALILYALYSSECMIVVCSNESYLQTVWVKNEYTRFLKLVNDEEKESDSIAVVFSGKPVEKLPGRKGKLQGIDINSFGASDKVVAFVDSHTPEAKKKREDAARRKREEEEERRKLLDELRSQKQEIKFCLSCGTQNPASVKFCGECGGTEFANTLKEYADAVRKKAEDEIRKKIEEEKKGIAAEQNVQTPFKPKPIAVPTPEPQKKIEKEGEVKSDSPKPQKGNEPKTITTGSNEKVDRNSVALKFSDFYIKNGEITGYRGNGSNVVIPDVITGIGDNAFYNCSSLTSIEISDSVTHIGNSAFYGCRNLTSVTLPNSVTSIGNRAFEDCSSLTSIEIPDSVINIGNRVFSNCINLTNITLPNSLTIIVGETFYNCSNLISVTIPYSVTNIGNMAFSGCSSLTSIVIPDSVTSIGIQAFDSCKRLTGIKISDSVTRIGNGAFSNCSNLASIVVPKSVTNIGSGAFKRCRSFMDITFKGTLAQWNSVIKDYWDDGVLNYTVHCTDGDINK